MGPLLCSDLTKENVSFGGLSLFFAAITVQASSSYLSDALSPSCLGLPKGQAPVQWGFGDGDGGGAASSPEPLQPPPCPVLSTSNIFRAKISVYTCEAVSFCEILGSTVVRWSTYPRAAAAVSRMLVSRVGWSSLTWWRELLKSCLWDVEETCELVGKKS